MFGKNFSKTLLWILALELISLAGFIYAPINLVAFLAICVAVLALSLKKFEYGIFLLLAELFIGSKGYLFSLNIGGTSVSIRIALWLIIMAVWVAKLLISAYRDRKLTIPLKDSKFFRLYAVFFLFILWGSINGLIRGNQLGNLFFDLNGWLYLAIILPIYTAYDGSRKAGGADGFIGSALEIFIASSVWVALETLALMFIFSHDINFSSVVYRWVRTTGVGEITPFMGGFSRIFIQSQIYMLIALFPFLYGIAKRLKEQGVKNFKMLIPSLAIVTLFISAILASLSRSFWLGLAGGLAIFYLTLIVGKLGWRTVVSSLMALIATGFLSLVLIIAIGRFPYPNPLGSFDATSLFSSRATQLSGEAGASSRWALLPELAKGIESSPILGSGFGTTVTYKTSDPRILQSNPNGLYTTYAFEWGWLDIWLKTGLFGLLSYIVLIVVVFWTGVKVVRNPSGIWSSSPWLAIGLAVISITSISSPYTNHPLGLGYLMLAALAIENYNERSS